MPNKLWIDDLRIPPDDSFEVARTFEEACDALWEEQFDEVYLDHDLACWENDGSGKELTGYDVVLWMAEMQARFDTFHVPKKYFMLTDNPVGRKNMTAVIERYLGKVEQWTKPADLKSLVPNVVRRYEALLAYAVPVDDRDKVIARGVFYFDQHESETSIGMTISSWRQQHINRIVEGLFEQRLLIDGTPQEEQ